MAAVQLVRSGDPEQEGNQGKGDRFWPTDTEGGGGGRFGASVSSRMSKRARADWTGVGGETVGNGRVGALGRVPRTRA